MITEYTTVEQENRHVIQEMNNIYFTKKNLEYKDPSTLLKDIGVHETDRNITNKLSRGTFGFVFVFQVFKALGLKKLRLED